MIAGILALVVMWCLGISFGYKIRQRELEAIIDRISDRWNEEYLYNQWLRVQLYKRSGHDPYRQKPEYLCRHKR